MKKVVAIIVTYNRLKHLKNIIPLLKSQAHFSCDIIIVNNGSTDSTAEWLSLPENSDLIVFSQTNSGGAGGFNRGIKEAFKLGYEYFWLMDDDVYPEPESLNELMKASKKLDEEYGFLASYVKGKNSNTINVPVPEYSLNASTNYAMWADDLVTTGYIRLSMATFVSVLFKREIISKIGLPIKEFFIWCDDFEYTRRASRLKPSYFIPSSIVIHKRNIEKSPQLVDEIEENRIKMHFYAVRNQIYLIKTDNNYLKSTLKILNYIITLFITVLGPQCLFKGRKALIVLKAFIAGIFFSPQIEKIHN